MYDEITRDLQHLSLQFEGGEILLMPFPENSKSSAEAAIKEKSGFGVNLAEKGRRFFLGELYGSAIRAERLESPITGSIIYECGNCIILSISRLVGDSDLCQSSDEVARKQPSSRVASAYVPTLR